MYKICHNECYVEQFLLYLKAINNTKVKIFIKIINI